MTLPNIPEPEHFTLEQISQRWECPEDDLIQYCKDNILKIGTIINGSIGFLKVEPETVFDEEANTQIKLQGFYILSASNIENIWNSSDFNDEDPALHVKTVYTDNESNSKPSSATAIKLVIPHIITASNLRISSNERNRFEHEHDLQITLSQKVIKQIQSIKPKKPLQKSREMALKIWLEGLGYNLNAQIELKPTRKIIWETLSEINKKLFPPPSEDGIKKFFDAQELCSFKKGRKY